MSADEELCKFFDDVDGEPEHSNVNGGPSSSMSDDLIVDDTALPSEPIASSTDGALKRPGEAEGTPGSKRVRIEEPPNAEKEFIDTLVAMGYDKNKVMSLFIMRGKNLDMNQMLDALSNQQDFSAGDVGVEGGRNNSPFDESVHSMDKSVLEQLANMSEIIRPSPQKALASFVDLCDEFTLRKFLNMKPFVLSEETVTFVVRAAALMGQRLNQVCHVSQVAKLADEIFVVTELYRNFKLRLPREPMSLIIDRASIMQSAEAQFGVLIDVAEAFVNNDGLNHVKDRIEDPAMSIRDMGSICSILSNVVGVCVEGSLEGLMAEAADRMRAMMAEQSEKDIRDEKIRREIIEASRKVCKGMKGASGTPSPRYEFLERLMLCGNMEAKKNAMDELVIICENELDEAFAVRRWMKQRNILPILLSDHLDHPEYVHKLGPILRKVAPVLSEREFRTVWCLQRGRGGISTDTYIHLLANLAAGFEEDQILMLFEYFKKQLRHPPAYMHQHTVFLRLTDIVLFVLARAHPTAIGERRIFLECYMRMVDRTFSSFQNSSLMFGTPQYGLKIAELFRGLPPILLMTALGKIAKEISRMKELDRRFPFYMALLHNIPQFIKTDLPVEYLHVGPLLAHHRFAEKVTRLLAATARHTLAEVDRMEQLSRVQEEMVRVRVTYTRQQQAVAAAAAVAATAAADAAASSLQPSPAAAAAEAAAAEAAPPPSAVTPISNGPSPKRDASPPGSSTQVSPEAALPAASEARQEEKGKERKEEVVTASSVCTPPCTPEPLSVSIARVGTKEFDRELAESTTRISTLATDLSLRLLNFVQLVVLWQDITMGDEVMAGCEVSSLPPALLQELFGLLIEFSKNGLNKRVIQFQNNPFLTLMTQPNYLNMVGALKGMIRALEQRPVFRALVTRLCATPVDAVGPYFVSIVQTVTEMCFASPQYNTQTDWLEEVLRMQWRLATSKMPEVRDKAVDALKHILCERYRTLRLVNMFAITRFNEAVDNFNRFSGRDPLPHWAAMQEDAADENMEVDEEIKDQRTEEGEVHNGEQAIDLSLEPREKRARTQSAQAICKRTVERLIRKTHMQPEVKTREEAEVQLCRTISFVRRIVTYGYLEATCPHSLIIRDRALPGEMAEMTMKLTGPAPSSQIISFFLTANEPVSVFAERVSKILPLTPPSFRAHWPRGYKVRHFSSTISWDKGWAGVGDQLNLNARSGMDDLQILVNPSPFNDDFTTEASARRDTNPDKSRMHLEETPLGHIANATKLVSILHGALAAGPSSNHLQEAVTHCLQQLPLMSIGDDENLMEISKCALQLQKPHEALYHLISLLSALLPPRLTRSGAAAAARTLDCLRRTGFLVRFLSMIREVDVISERLSIDAATLFHEVCLTLIRLFYLNESGRQRAARSNEMRLPSEPLHINTKAIGESLHKEEVTRLLRTLMHFAWAIIAPRRIDVERELSLIVPSPSDRLQLAKERKVENVLTYRRQRLTQATLATMIDIAIAHGDWECNANALFNVNSIEGDTLAFWRDILMHGLPEVQRDARSLLTNLLDRMLEDEDDRLILRRLLVTLVFELGTPVWGPVAAVAYTSAGRDPIELLRLAEKVVRATNPEEMEDGLLDKWSDLEIGFISEERPMWNARCHMGVHVQLLQELLRKHDKETMGKMVRSCLHSLLSHALFPFTAGRPEMAENCGKLPAAKAIGCGLAEGDVRRKYMEIVVTYAHAFPDMGSKGQAVNVNYLIEYFVTMFSQMRIPDTTIVNWDHKTDSSRFRRPRAESFCGPLNLAQRLQLGTRDIDVRMVKGLINPSFMCYANSVLQQLVFMPGVCEALYAIGNTDEEFGDLTEDDDIKNGALLRCMQGLFANMLFSCEPSQSALYVLDNIELPSGGSVREQQDCVEFYLTLIDKCDMAAEKFNRPPVFKRFLGGVMGYEYACKTCKHRHRGADESFTALNLEIHGQTVLECLDHYMDGALLDGASAAMCEQCGEKRTTLRIGALRSAPTTLCIQLKRFSTFEHNGGKLNSKVDVPRELDLTRFSEAVRTASDSQVDAMFGWFDDAQDEPVVFTPQPDCPVRWRYRLVGVIVHSGQLGNGHYTSYVKERRPVMRGRPWFDHWLLANDDRVSVQEDRLQMEWQGNGDENSPSAYLLWYEMFEEDAVREVTVVREEDAVREVTVVREDEAVAAPAATPDVSMARQEDEPESAAEIAASAVPLEEELEEEEEDTAVAPLEDEEMLLEDEEDDDEEEEEEDEEEEEEYVEDPMSNVSTRQALFMQHRMEEDRKRKRESEWMDIGLGPLGVLEGPLLELWKCVPDRLHEIIVLENMTAQQNRDVNTESFARILLQLFEVSLDHIKRSPPEGRVLKFRGLLQNVRLFVQGVLWRTMQQHSLDAEPMINRYRLLVENLLKEHVDMCALWLRFFFDTRTRSVSEDARELTHGDRGVRSAISAWWLLAAQAIISLRDQEPVMVAAYCAHMVESLRLSSFRIDGFQFFCIQTMENPHCIENLIRHGILERLVIAMFYRTKNKATSQVIWGLQGDFTARAFIPINVGLCTLFRSAIERGLITEKTFRDFAETRLHLAMGPLTRHGEEYMLKMIGLLKAALNIFGEQDRSWIGLIAQAILTCLKTDVHRSNSLFFVVTTVAKGLAPERARDFYDEILGKRETEAAENGLIVPGVVAMLENMLAARRESRQIQLLENALHKAMEAFPLFNERALAYIDRIEAIKQRAEEWREEEPAYRASATKSMLMGAEALSMLPIDACGPINRPPGAANGGRDLDTMQVSDGEDEIEDEEDEMMSDDEDYSDGEGAMNLSNRR